MLIDASPDCRAQLLDADISRLDGIVFTHAHADHCHGIDDLRWINQAMRKALPAFSDATTFSEMNKRFGYAFAPFEVPDHGYFNRPVLEWREAGMDFRSATWISSALSKIMVSRKPWVSLREGWLFDGCRSARRNRI